MIHGEQVGRITILFEIPHSSFIVAEILQNGNDPAILDTDSDYGFVMWVPPTLLGAGIAGETLTGILRSLAVDANYQAQRIFDRGERAGVENTQHFLHKLLGIDKIAESLRDIERRIDS